MEVNIYKSDAKVLMVLQVGYNFLPQVEEFKCPTELFMSEVKKKQKIVRWIGAAEAEALGFSAIPEARVLCLSVNLRSIPHL